MSFTGIALSQLDADSQGDPREAMAGYGPAATYESGRVFFAGSKASARRLLDAFENVAAQSEPLAKALRRADEGGLGLEAVLCEWPKGEMAVLTLCNTNHSEEREMAVADILSRAEDLFPGVVSGMESRIDK